MSTGHGVISSTSCVECRLVSKTPQTLQLKLTTVMSLQPKQFYDDLAHDYHLIFKDWEQWMINQGQILHQLISTHHNFVESNPSDMHILDCAAGIGTQAIGLALQGYQVHATDISPDSIERAKKESMKFLKRNQNRITFGIADFCNLQKNEYLSQKKHAFDIVICCDNALPHLLTAGDIEKALKSMKSMLRNNGILILSVRDYALIREQKYLPSGTPPKCYIRKNDNDKLYRQITFQNWEWSKCRNYYKVHHFVMIEKYENNQCRTKEMNSTANSTNIEFGSDEWNLSEIKDITDWNIHCRTTMYNALSKDDLIYLLRKAGFASIEWLLPANSKYYQPIIIAKGSMTSCL